MTAQIQRVLFRLLPGAGKHARQAIARTAGPGHQPRPALNRYRVGRGRLPRRIPQLLTSLTACATPRHGYHAPVLERDCTAASRPLAAVVTTVAHFDTALLPRRARLIDRHLIPIYQRRGLRILFLPLMGLRGGTPRFGPALPRRVRRQLLWLARRGIAHFTTAGRGGPGPTVHRPGRTRSEPLRSATHLYNYLEAQSIPEVSTPEEYAVFRYLYCQATPPAAAACWSGSRPAAAHFGGDWQNYLPDSPLLATLHGYLPIHEEAKYSNTAISRELAHHRPVTGPNMRFFNVPGMGGFQISDRDSPRFSNPVPKPFINLRDEIADRVHIAGTSRRGGRIRLRPRAGKRDWTYRAWIARVFTNPRAPPALPHQKRIPLPMNWQPLRISFPQLEKNLERLQLTAGFPSRNG